MKRLLKHPPLYALFQTVIGAKRARKRCILQYARPRDGERVLDVGCGPGFVVDYLPNVRYVGVDIDERSVQYARKRYGHRAEFHCVELTKENVGDYGTFDIVMLNGVLHHIDDQGVLVLLEWLSNCMGPGARLMTLDGCYRQRMSSIGRYLLRRDRGRHVRPSHKYARIAEKVFSHVEIYLRSDLFYVRYDAIVMLCRNQAPKSLSAA